MFRRPPRSMNRRGIARSSGGDLASIFGSNLVEYWDASLGIALASGNVDTWTGQKRGIVLQAIGAANRPTYDAANANFSAQPTVNAATSSTRAMRATGVSPNIVASGTRPAYFIVGRFRTIHTDGGSHRVIELGVSGSADRFGFISKGTPVTGDATCIVNVNAANSAVYTSPDTDAHVYECYQDTLIAVAVDGSDAATDPDTANIASACSAVGLGCAASVAVHFIDFDYAWVGILTAKPSSAARQAALVLARNKWGTP